MRLQHKSANFSRTIVKAFIIWQSLVWLNIFITT